VTPPSVTPPSVTPPVTPPNCQWYLVSNTCSGGDRTLVYYNPCVGTDTVVFPNDEGC
jgi:hypothetical protein